MITILSAIFMTALSFADPSDHNENVKGQAVEKSQDNFRAAVLKLKRMVSEGQYQEVDDGIRDIIASESCDNSSLRQLRYIIRHRSAVGHKVTGSFNNDKHFKWINPRPNTKQDSLNEGWKILIAWELWCPHCKREVPQIDKLMKEIPNTPYSLIGLTQLSRSGTTSNTKEFILENQISFPTAVVDRKILDGMKVSGIPAAAVLHRGKIIWRGHPSNLNAPLLTQMTTWNTETITPIDTALLEAMGKKNCTSKPLVENQQQQSTEAISKQLQEARRLDSEYNFVGAREIYREIVKQSGSSSYKRIAQRRLNELELIGTKAPEQIEIESWLNHADGKASLNLATGETLIVFWELWCPHCKRALPKIQEEWTNRGIKVIGLTTLSRNQSKEEIASFFREMGIGFPSAHYSGTINQQFAVKGIPAAVFIKDGIIRWRGHPSLFTLEAIDDD